MVENFGTILQDFNLVTVSSGKAFLVNVAIAQYTEITPMLSHVAKAITSGVSI